MKNPLDRILIVPDFLARARCEQLVSGLLPNRETPTIEIAPQAPLDPEIRPHEVVDPNAALRTLISNPARIAPLLAHVDASARVRLGRMQGASDLDQELAGQLLRSALAAARTPSFFATIASSVDVRSDPIAHFELRALLDGGILIENGGRISVRGDLTDEEHLFLTWFHLRVLGELFLGGALRKTNRLLKAPVDCAAVSRSFASDACDLIAFARDRLGDERTARELASGTYHGIQIGLLRLLRSAESRRAFLDAYAGPLVRTDAALQRSFDALRDDVADQLLVQHVLHRLFPFAIVAPTPARGTYKGLRSCSTMDSSAIRADLEAEIRRLASDYVEPHFAIHVRRGIAELGVLRYESSDYFLDHVDSEVQKAIDGETAWEKYIDRDVSILVYLSDPSDFTGGALRFTAQHVHVEPKQGMAVVFPSDHRYPHAALEVTSGVRYAVVSWLTCEEGIPVGARHRTAW